MTEVAGPERSAEQVGRDLKASLERSGWREMSGRDTAHSYGDVQYPYRFRREADSGFSYLFLLPVYPGTYGLAYDEDGDTLDGG